MTRTLHLRISGRVQGVGFRDALCREAQLIGINGWVRNRRDGTVEAVVQGSPAALEKMLAWARRGPPAARVSDVSAAAAQSDPLVGAMLAVAANGIPMPSNPEMGAFWSAMGPALTNITTGVATPADALNDAATRILAE